MRATALTLLLILGSGYVLAEDGVPSAAALVAEANAEITEMSPAVLNSEPLAGRVLIDVREPAEFAAGHIDGAVNHPRGTLEFTINRHPVLAALAEKDPSRVADTEIVLYCRSGTRSALAAQTLQEMGFKNVYSLSGGFTGWQAAQEPKAP
jgi:rhodanese-related sulfurtransferase